MIVASPTLPTPPFYLSVLVWPASTQSGRSLYILMSTSNKVSLILVLKLSTSLHSAVPPTVRRRSAAVPPTCHKIKNPSLNLKNSFCFEFLWIPSNAGRHNWKGPFFIGFNLINQQCVNPISTRGDRLCPPNYYWHTRIFRPTYRRPCS